MIDIIENDNDDDNDINNYCLKATKHAERLFKMIDIIKNDNDDDNDINDYCLKASKHAERLFKMIDIDGDGNLTQNEFLRVVIKNFLFQTRFTHSDLLCRAAS